MHEKAKSGDITAEEAWKRIKRAKNWVDTGQAQNGYFEATIPYKAEMRKLTSTQPPLEAISSLAPINLRT